MCCKGVASTRRQRLNFFTALKVMTTNNYLCTQDNTEHCSQINTSILGT